MPYACAACGDELDGGLLDSVIVSDLGADGVPVVLYFGRPCGHARELLRPSLLEHHVATAGELPPARTGKEPASHERRPARKRRAARK